MIKRDGQTLWASGKMKSVVLQALYTGWRGRMALASQSGLFTKVGILNKYFLIMFQVQRNLVSAVSSAGCPLSGRQVSLRARAWKWGREEEAELEVWEGSAEEVLHWEQWAGQQAWEMQCDEEGIVSPRERAPPTLLAIVWNPRPFRNQPWSRMKKLFLLWQDSTALWGLLWLWGEASGSTLSKQILREGCSQEPGGLRLALKAPHSLGQALSTSQFSSSAKSYSLWLGWPYNLFISTGIFPAWDRVTPAINLKHLTDPLHDVCCCFSIFLYKVP